MNRLYLILGLCLVVVAQGYANDSTTAGTAERTGGQRPRVIVSTDIGGTDPDDFQSMVHLLVYADVLDIEGLISSPFDMGRKEDILQVIDCYEKDYANLKTYSDLYPTPDALRAVTKQGEIDRAPYAGVRGSTEGSRWIIECARRDDPRPLNILVWGLIEDLAQALHDAPDILPKLRVYWIGGPNKKWSPDAYQYVVDNHPELWIIESNSTYRGWFVGGDQAGEWGNREFVNQHIAGKGALGDFFAGKMNRVKMGDSPSVGWLLKGTPEDPAKPGWGGRFVRAWERPYVRFDRLTTQNDRMEIFGICELVLPLGDDAPDKPETQIHVGGQELDGYAPGDGTMHFRFCPKSKGNFSYKFTGNVPALEGVAGKITVELPETAQADQPASNLPNWWTDDPNPAYAEGDHHGGKTVSRWREDFLADFAQRMVRAEKPASAHNTKLASGRPRVLVTSDGEIDDECSMVRFLLYSNEFDIEGIVKTSSQYHWQGHNWAGDDWEKPIYEAYGEVYPNLVQHDPGYPTLAYLESITKLGNVKSDGEMTLVTEGSQHIVDVLLDDTDNRPIWLQAWGGMNTIARALKTIEEEHPERMAEVAAKCRFYFIWEQDNTFQSYIRPNWATPYNIPTIISDQFITFGYWWQRWNMPKEPDAYLREPWMKENIFKNDNRMLAIYNEKTKIKLKGKEDFIGEGDSPSFIHQIPTGLRSTESPDWGGWGGRYVLVRESTWLDRVPVEGYEYPSGRWYTKTGWGRQNYTKADQDDLEEYFKPITRWIGAIQNDFAARVDWCVKPYAEANHEPVVKLAHALDLKAKPGATVELSAKGTNDPDGDELSYLWWQYEEADTYQGSVDIQGADKQEAKFIVPSDAVKGQTVHVICEVTDDGTPALTRYQRVVLTVE